MKTKMCNRCHVIKPVSEFGKDKKSKDGLRGHCKKCACIMAKEWVENNREKYLEQIRVRRNKNRDKINARRRELYALNKEAEAEKAWQWRNNNKDKVKATEERYRRNNKEKIKENQKRYWAKKTEAEIREYRHEHRHNKNKWKKKKAEQDPSFRLNRNISLSIWRSLKNNGTSKNGRDWFDIVGYSLEELKRHLESQFQEGMTWDNYQHGVWQIDHIIPLSMFKFDSVEHPNFRKAWALDNLQPLFSAENSQKHNKLYWDKEGTLDF